MNRFLAIVTVALLCGVGSTALRAQVKMDGSFVASKSCPALSSIKKGRNPGNAAVVPGTAYAVRGKNKEEASHFLIVVPDAQPPERWVQVDCGQIDGAATATPPVVPKAVPAKQPATNRKAADPGAPFYILALSWEPAFCEAHGDKSECRSAKADDHEAQNFSLHGLWPQPRSAVFCNVREADKAQDDNHRWENLPEPALTPETKSALDKVMPGTQSMLERHEYTKHGTCYPASADQYFKDAVRLVEAVNASPVQALIAANVGKTIKTADLRAAFDEGFGRGAGLRVRVACDRDDGRLLITEITIGLKGDIPGGAPMDELMAASLPTDAGCPAGVIDPAGRQ